MPALSQVLKRFCEGGGAPARDGGERLLRREVLQGRNRNAAAASQGRGRGRGGWDGRGADRGSRRQPRGVLYRARWCDGRHAGERERMAHSVGLFICTTYKLPSNKSSGRDNDLHTPNPKLCIRDSCTHTEFVCCAAQTHILSSSILTRTEPISHTAPLPPPLSPLSPLPSPHASFNPPPHLPPTIPSLRRSSPTAACNLSSARRGRGQG